VGLKALLVHSVQGVGLKALLVYSVQGAGLKAQLVHSVQGVGIKALLVYSVQGAGLKALLVHSWYVWSFNLRNVRVYTAQSLWHAKEEEALAAARELDAVRTALQAELRQVSSATQGHDTMP
jgi:hypothetical protein